jgi:hypothetical protein
MSALPPKSPATAAPFSDAFGYRVLGFDKKSGDRLEMLRLRPQLASSAPFEAALRERQRRLSDFRHPAFARVRQIDRPAGQSAALAVVSNHFEGLRLSELLKVVEAHGLRLDLMSAMCMLRQVAAAVARLHECGDDISHGALNPERLVVSASGRVIVTEYVLGAGLEALAASRQQVWQDYRVALPVAAAPARLDHAADIFQLGYVGLTLVSGRSLYERQYPAPFADRLQAAGDIQLEGRPQTLHPAIHTWLSRALWLDAVPFPTAAEAQNALEEAIASAGLVAAPDAVVDLLERCFAAAPDLRPRESVTESTLVAQPIPVAEPRSETPSTWTAPAAPAPSFDIKPTTLAPEVETTSQTAGLALLEPEPGAAASVADLLVDAQTAARSDANPTIELNLRPVEPIVPAPVVAADPAPVSASLGAEAGSALPAARPWSPQAPAERQERTKPEPATPAVVKFESPRTETARADSPRTDARPEPRQHDAKSQDSKPHEAKGHESKSVETSAFSRYSEPADAAVAPATGAAAKPSVRRPYLIALGMAVVMVGIFEVFIRYVNPFGGTPAKAVTASELHSANGTLAIDATSKAKVFIDDKQQGETPFRADLPAGQHRVRLEADGAARSFVVNVISGKEISQLVELSSTAVNGIVDVKSDPAGARVLLDGRNVGVSPISIPDVKPGTHALMVEGPNGSIRQVVQVTAGATASVFVPLNTAASNLPTGGWLTIDAPEEMHVYEGGRLLGTSRTERIMLQAGNHDLELRNDAVGFSTTRNVQIQGGKLAKVSIQLPDGTLSLNATPWAEVFVDGQRVGETPVGNVAVRAGTHEVVFRHPQHGEVRQTVVVKAGEAGRVTVNMAK